MYYCGIDIAKHQHCVTIIDQEGKLVQQATSVANTRAGFAALLALLQPYAEQIHIGLESTGHYWLALYDQLTRAGYPVTVLNALQIRAYRKLDLRKRKTDRWDAFWIADFMRYALPAATAPRLPLLVQLRELTRFRFRLTQQIGDRKRQIIAVLDRVFPEYETLFSQVFLLSSRRLLHAAVTAEDFAAFDLSELEQLLHSTSRGHFGAAQAQRIQQAAQDSVGVRFLADAAHTMMRCLLAQLELLEAQRDEVEAQIAGLLAQFPQYLTTIPGIGPVTGAALLAEIGDVQRFATLESLVAYTGIDPSVYRSGQFEGTQMRMSKRGAPYLRNALWQAASAALLANPELRDYYDKKRAEGKPHGVAMGAVCRKLLARVYVILKEQRPYTASPPTAQA